MASRYFKLAFSTIGALGFGLVAAAVFLPQTFNGIFNPDAGKSAPTAVEREALRAAASTLPNSTENVNLPQTKDALDMMADALKASQDQQAAEVSAVMHNITPDKPADAAPVAAAPVEAPAPAPAAAATP